jgi:hypothetical protein
VPAVFLYSPLNYGVSLWWSDGHEDLEHFVRLSSHMICHMLTVELLQQVFESFASSTRHSSCQLPTTWPTTRNDRHAPHHMAAVTMRNYHHLNHPCLTTTTINNNNDDHHHHQQRDDDDHEVTITTTTITTITTTTTTWPPSP